MVNTVIMPKQGLQMTEGVIIKWFYAEGDTVKAGQPLFQMETDKLTIDIDSQFDGTLLKIIAREGDTVPITETIAYIGDAGEAIPETVKTAEPASAPANPPASPSTPAIPAAPSIPMPEPSKDARTKKQQKIYISPRAKMKANELGIDYGAAASKGKLRAGATTVNGNAMISERDILTYTPEPERAAVMEAFMEISINEAAANAFLSMLEAGGISCGIFVLSAFALAKASRAGVGRVVCNTDVSDTDTSDSKNGFSVSSPAQGKALSAFAASLNADNDDCGESAQYAAADFTSHKISVCRLPLAGELTALLTVCLSEEKINLCLSFDTGKLSPGRAADMLDKLVFMLENPTLMLSM